MAGKNHKIKYHVLAWFEVEADDEAQADAMIRDRDAMAIVKINVAPKGERAYLKYADEKRQKEPKHHD